MLLKKTNITVPCMLSHQNCNNAWVRENLRISYNGSTEEIKYSAIFCVDCNFNISPMCVMVNGVPMMASTEDITSGVELYQNFMVSQYFVRINDRFKNDMWVEPHITCYIPDKSSMRLSKKEANSTGYDMFEFELGELNRIMPQNFNAYSSLDLAAPKLVVQYRTRVLAMLKAKGTLRNR